MKIKDAERSKAQRLAMSSAGAALEGDVQIEAREAALSDKQKSSENTSHDVVKTFTPGEGQSAKESFVVNFTKEQKIEIKNMIANARSPAEIEKIEECVKRGEFPHFAASS